jgi:hypothetical protein
MKVSLNIEEDKELRDYEIIVYKVPQNSIAKLEKTKELIKNHSTQRILVFCGITKIADSLGIPSYHSKSSEKEIFNDFVEGRIDKLAVYKIGVINVTFKLLNRVIISYFDSNCENLTQKINYAISFEYNNPEKKALINIICSNESIEEKYLQSAISMFNPMKIKYVWPNGSISGCSGFSTS